MPKPSPTTAPAVANGKANFATRVGTGKARHVTRLPAHSLWARRDRELWHAIVSDLGGADGLSELETQLVRRCVSLCLQLEMIEAELAAGERPDPSATATLINCFNRTASLIGLKRRARDVTPNIEDFYVSEDATA